MRRSHTLGFLIAAALAGGCHGRPRAAPSPDESAPVGINVPSVVEIDLTRGLPEVAPAALFNPVRGRTHFDLVRILDRLGDESTAKGVFVRLGSSRLSFARAHEVGRLLGGLRTKGLPVVCHADDYNNASALLAAAGCSKLWISPAGSFDTVGIAAQLVYGNRLLTKLQVDVDFLQVGKYKGASEPFTRDGPSPEARESLERALGGLRTSWLEGIRAGRSGNEAIAAAMEDGPFAAEDAKARGLVDAVGYTDEAKDDAKKLAQVDRVGTRFGAGEAPETSRGLIEVFRSLSGAGEGGLPHVAVVRAVGAITMSSSPSPLGGSEGITERELGKLIVKLTHDESTKAVVLRIDSPGGSALASDLLWRKLIQLRDKKPLVVSVGSMAASGGYYLSCAASKIVAEPTSIVGSIGVVGGKFAVGKALDEIGIHAETVAAAPEPGKASRAAYLSPFTPWDDATRSRMLASMTAVYDLFLRRVAEGRSMPIAKVAESAEGRIFGGVEAKDRGLVDELGGLHDAIEVALRLASLPDDAPVEAIGDAPGLLDFIDGDEDTQSEAKRQLAGEAERTAIAALLPDMAQWAPEVSNFVASAAPIVAGERTLAALPFVFVLR